MATPMKNIALFCDGTWQSLDQSVPTNVARLARAVAPQTKGVPGVAPGTQFVYYDDGVGVGQGILNKATQLIGGGLGEGLEEKILHAYEFLCLNYSPGDRIFIFGFSRGAYTARSLAGLLRKCWILRRENVSDSDMALGYYRNPELKVDAPEVKEFRQSRCHAAEAFTGERGTDPIAVANGLAPARANKANDDQYWGHVQYVGVWDTVGALGIPKTIPFAPDFNARYRFHDTSLSRFVLSARHAVSIDERRTAFSPTLWDNIDTLNTNAGADGLPYESRPYQQSWFPGRHSGVGGGEDDGGLSIMPLLWIAEGAAAAGLEFNPDALNLPPPGNCCAPFVKPKATLASLAIRMIGGEADRKGPGTLIEISEAARTRWNSLPEYRPPPLKGFADRLGPK
jgi:uncharacterized protein (DUF2235 family)